MRYYPQGSTADFNAAIIAELGLPVGTRIVDVWERYTAVQGGWRKEPDTAGNATSSDAKPRSGPGGKRRIPPAAAARINALRRRLLRMGDEEGAEECRKALEELRWSAD